LTIAPPFSIGTRYRIGPVFTSDVVARETCQMTGFRR